MSSGIYCFENKLNGKKYIGQAFDLKTRMAEHHKECKVLRQAIEKYRIAASNKGKSRSPEQITVISNSKMGIKNYRFGKKESNSSSIYRGVYFLKGDKNKNSPWKAWINVLGKCVYIGVYKTEIEAALAYDKYVRDCNLSNPTNFLAGGGL